jgi:hypothetical protein
MSKKARHGQSTTCIAKQLCDCFFGRGEAEAEAGGVPHKSLFPVEYHIKAGRKSRRAFRARFVGHSPLHAALPVPPLKAFHAKRPGRPRAVKPPRSYTVVRRFSTKSKFFLHPFFTPGTYFGSVISASKMDFSLFTLPAIARGI